MKNWICETCGTQFDAAAAPPAHCPICEDERQYVGWNGQRWTTLEDLRRDHSNRIEDDAGVIGIGTVPGFAISQRALLLQTAAGNVLWDCITLLDDATRAEVARLGGIDAIAISHPHFYSGMVEWSHAFGGVPIYLHEADREWVMRRDGSIVHWSGESREILPGVTLLRLGGHFPGGTVLHWADGADGAGALFVGDIIAVVQDRRSVSFMYSFPNLIPLPAAEVQRIAAAVEPYAFERVYGGWWGLNVLQAAKAAVRRSAERYQRAIERGSAARADDAAMTPTKWQS